jgi:hypothetical protein
MNNEQKLILEVTLAETQAILEALSHLPFRQVSGLIQNLQTQATTQLQTKAQNGETQNKNQELVK